MAIGTTGVAVIPQSVIVVHVGKNKKKLRNSWNYPTKCITFAPHLTNGVMLEWLKRHAWKACIRQKRIPSSNLGHSAKKDDNCRPFFISQQLFYKTKTISTISTKPSGLGVFKDYSTHSNNCYSAK